MQLLANRKNEILDAIENDSLSDFLLKVADLNSNKPAIEAKDEVVTYNELKRKTLAYADFLIFQYNITPGDIVVIDSFRCIEQVIAILATIVIGGTFAPVDLSQRSRAKKIIDNIDPALICSSRLFEEYSSLVPMHNLKEAESSNSIEDTSKKNERDLPRYPVYLLHTSGTTGSPKGVLVGQSAILNRVLWAIDYLNLTTKDRVLYKTPLTFDVSIPEILAPLLAGACLVIAKPDGHEDPIYLSKTIQEKRISCLHFVPTMANQFCMLIEANHPSVRIVMYSGEQLFRSTYIAMKERFSSRHINLYGPTEAAVDVTYLELDEHDIPQSRIPIGKVIENVTIKIVDLAGREVETGKTGEIAIQGICLADSYYRMPIETKSRFIKLNGVRTYMTGDIGFISSDGNINYSHRNDGQLKINGQRIESDEIRDAFIMIPQITECIIDVIDDDLTAYVFSSIGKKITYNELKEEFIRELDIRFFPTRIFLCKSLYFNANGKINKEKMISLSNVSELIFESESQESDISSTIVSLVKESNLPFRNYSEHINPSKDLNSIQQLQLIGFLHKRRISVRLQDVKAASSLNELDELIIFNKKKSSSISDCNIEKVKYSLHYPPVYYQFEQWGIKYPDSWYMPLLIEYDQRILKYETLINSSISTLKKLIPLSVFYSDGKTYVSHQHRQIKVIQENYKPLTKLKDVQNLLNVIANENASDILIVSIEYCERTLVGILIPHYLVDGISLRIIFDEIALNFDSDNRKTRFLDPYCNDSNNCFIDWIDSFHSVPITALERDYWMKILPNIQNGNESKENIDFENKTEDHWLEIEIKTDDALSEMEDVFLASAVCSYFLCIGEDQLIVDIEHHGRNRDCDVTLVGWLTSISPTIFNRPTNKLFRSIINDIRNNKHSRSQFRESYSRMLASGEIDPSDVRSVMKFNFLGLFEEGAGTPINYFDSAIPIVSKTSEVSTHLIDITFSLFQDKLSINIKMNNRVFSGNQIDKYKALLLDFIGNKY